MNKPKNFIVLDYGAMKDEEEAKEQLSIIEQNEQELKLEGKKE